MRVPVLLGRPSASLVTKILLLFPLLLLLVSAEEAYADIDVPTATPDPASFQFSRTFFSNGNRALDYPQSAASGPQYNYTFYWSVLEEGTANATLRAGMQLAGMDMKWAWVGMGFGRSMLEAQFIVCHQMSGTKYPDPTKIEMHEHVTAFKYAPPIHFHGKQITIPLRGSFVDNTLFCEFTRPIRPADGIHMDINLNADTAMLWAFNPTSQLNTEGTWFTYHGPNHRGAVAASLARGDMLAAPTKSFEKKLIHGYGMMTVWLGLFPFAAFYARYLRSTAGWTIVHMVIQTISVSGIIVFTVVILTDWTNLSKAHAKIGITLLSFIAFQFVLGMCSLLGLSNEQLYRVRKWVRGIHNRLGFLLILLAAVQVGLGLDKLFPWREPRGRAAWGLYFGAVAFWLMLFSATEIYFWKTVRRTDAKPSAYKAIGKGEAIPMDRMKRGATAVTLVDASATAVPMSNTRLRPDLQQYTWESLNQAIMSGGLFVVANGRYVYSIAQWMTSHPGGQLILHAVNGTDITNDYFHEAGFDAEEFVPKPEAPAQRSGRNNATLARKVTASFSTNTSSEMKHSLTSYGGNLIQELKVAPLMGERDWKLVVKSRRTHVHTRLAIQKLSNLLVGELVPDTHAFSPEASTAPNARPFDPNEYRRYALVENTPVAPLSNIVKFRFCLLYPYDVRSDEPEVIYPGQSIEICARINGKLVTRYYCPMTHMGGLSALEIIVKVYPNGIMSQYLFKQKPGERQVKIRGPFGTPLVHPERPLTLSNPNSWIPKNLMFVAGGTGITPFLQLLVTSLLPVAEPLRVQIDYVAQLEDELNLSRHDRVAIKHHYYDGWAIGVNLRTEQEGAFPLTVTAPLCGPKARITLVHAVRTASEAVLGDEWIEGAMLAYPSIVEVHRFIADGSRPENALGIAYPTHLTEANLEHIVRTRWYTDVDDERNETSEQCFICGPAGFDSWAVDALTELGVDMRRVVILPSDRVL